MTFLIVGRMAQLALGDNYTDSLEKIDKIAVVAGTRDQKGLRL